KKYPYLNSFLSFGGLTNNGVTTAPMFEQLDSNQQSMENFAKQSVELMRKLGFIGIDIDWEWWSDYGDDVAPAKKLLAFFKVLRAELD
ncbi:glycosyl hydrolase family 18 protein, partial [Francisella tularensis subsp. holarctica]|uniref:glycosyl hydrolase family 18 protein n=1 Tax=Francisella tularensis TaxID=263 RepID=UPI002381A85D